MRLLLLLACGVGVILGLSLAPEHALATDYNCSDFATQAAAQSFFLANGGPSSDPYGLDADHDGIACESNPCPCSTGTGGGGGGGGGGGHHPGHRNKKHRRILERPPRGGAVYVQTFCGNERNFEPPILFVLCTAVHLQIQQLSWTAWDATSATAQGLWVEVGCVSSPDFTCETPPATLTMLRPRYCINLHYNVFTKAAIQAPTAVDPNSRQYTQGFPCKVLKR
jgi:hypothetical protein